MDTRQYCLDYKILSASFNLSHDGKKKVYEGISWSKIKSDNIKSFHNNSKNGFMIVTGSKNKIIVLDCDINKADGAFPQDLLDYLDANCKSIVKTPNGKHYYFSTNKIIKKQTGAYWKKNKIPTFDILADGASIIAPPSHYTKGDVVVKYEWIVGGIDTLVELSEELFQFIQKPTSNISIDINTILQNISIEKYIEYTSWINIGMILKSEGYSCDLWEEYSKKAPNYQYGVCQTKWNSFADKSELTIATLYKYLKDDNPELFHSLKNTGVVLLDWLLDSTQASYAELFYINNDDKYIYDKEKKGIWYVLQDNNTWEIQSAVNLKIPIRNYIKQLIDRCKANLDNSEESENIKKQLSKSYDKISNSSFTDGIISWLKEYFTPSFNPFDVFDCNPNIIAFNNCLFDSTTLSYRDIVPTDYITITTGFNAPPLDYPIDDKLTRFFYSLFENEEQMRYFLRVLAYSLFGDRKHQELYLLTGSGGNGKSIIINLILNCLGNYCRNIPSTYLTKPSDGKEGALPTLADAKDARILYTSELEPKDTLQVGFLKTIAGGDMLTVRKLHCSSFTFKPQFNMFILCNDSKLSKVDPAITRRLRVIRFPFQFREEVRQSNERLIDKSLENYIKSSSCILSVITLLLKVYIEDVYNKESLNQSVQSINDTKEYLNENNPISTWLFENYNTNSEDNISAGDLLKHYNNENQKIRPNDLSNYLITLGFVSKSYQNKKYYNFKRKEIEFIE